MGEQDVEFSALLIDAITTIVIAFISFGIAALVPYLIARQRKKVDDEQGEAEAKKTRAEAGSIFIKDLKTIAGAASETQEIMLKALDAAAAREESYVAREGRFRKRIDDLEQTSETIEARLDITEKLIIELPGIRLRVEELIQENKKLVQVVKELGEVVISLRSLIERLVNQLQKMGAVPDVSKEQEKIIKDIKEK